MRFHRREEKVWCATTQPCVLIFPGHVSADNHRTEYLKAWASQECGFPGGSQQLNNKQGESFIKSHPKKTTKLDTRVTFTCFFFLNRKQIDIQAAQCRERGKKRTESFQGRSGKHCEKV